jgi:hypothetical protein
MHELNLGYTLQDYVTGEEVQATTYEDIRQEIARFLVEEKRVPKEAIQTKVRATVLIEGRTYVQQMDMAIGQDPADPIMTVKFCAGQIETYARQVLAASRLLDQGPSRLAVATDTRKAVILQVADGKMLRECSYSDLPNWEEMQELTQTVPVYALTEDKKAKEGRLLFALSELSCSCSQETCSLANKK